MKNFKKFLIVLVLILGITLVACGDESEKQPNDQEYERNTEYTDKLKLESDYENKSFLNDGIGKVTLYQCVDGDTAHLRDTKTNTSFTARFLCINTPESTGRIDPWGKAASNFVASKLKGAVELVCESKVLDKPAEKDTTLKRYLAYVWYKTDVNSDFRLLNLELIEEGYTKFTDVENEVKYGEIFQQAHLKSYALKIRDYGEKDPDYDYSGEIKEITIAEIRENINDYVGGTKIKITARIMRVIGDNMYLQDLNQTWSDSKQEYVYGSIYMYSGYGSGLGKLTTGQVISFECQCVINEVYGTQLTNPNKVRMINNTDEYSIVELDGSVQLDLGNYEGFVVSIKRLKVESVKSPDNEGAYTIYCVSQSGQKINVRVDSDVNPKLVNSSIVVGGVYDVIGGVSKFNETFQIMLANQTGDAANDFKLNE